MAKKPPPLSLRQRLTAVIKRNPIKAATTVLVLLGAIPGGIAGADYLGTTTEPWWIAQHYWVRDAFAPILKVQATHDYAIEYLIQQQTIKALNDAKADMAKAPNGTTQATINRLEKSIQIRQDKLDKAR